MSKPQSVPWLTIIGIGEDGLNGLSAASRSALDAAEIVFGGPRHLELAGVGAKGQPWTVPFSMDPVLQKRGRPVAVLASGNPFWFGAGGSLGAHLQADEWICFPAPSVFSLVAAQMGWRLEETLCLGLHAAPYARLTPLLAPHVPVICTLRDGDAPRELAEWLTQNGFGASQLTVLESLGGPRQRLRHCAADAFCLADISGPVAIAIMPAGRQAMPRASGLDDSLFASDGQITKRPVRALTLSALAPRPNETLWDIGAGSGSISIEWMLSAQGTRAVAFETRADRAENIASNGARFGLSHRLTVAQGDASDMLGRYCNPDVVFIGGGATHDLLQQLWDTLDHGTRVVANAVTLETETLLMQWQASAGGHLLRVELAEATPLGRMRGWNRARPVIQWSVTR